MHASKSSTGRTYAGLGGVRTNTVDARAARRECASAGKAVSDGSGGGCGSAGTAIIPRAIPCRRRTEDDWNPNRFLRLHHGTSDMT